MSDQLVEAAQRDDASDGLSTQPTESTGDAGIKLGFTGWLRWTWRQLTSMRTALLLLFLLALATVPGSLLPQKGQDPLKVAEYLNEQPGLGGFFNAIGFFNVFSAPWFAAIYLLLFVSVAGCVVPRTRLHWRAMRTPPPAAPSRLSRLPESRAWQSEQQTSAEAILEDAATTLRKRRWRVRTSEFDGTTGWVSAEKGYLREVGNLLFHAALLVVLFSVAAGGLLGWRGKVIVVAGNGFSNTLTQYDQFRPGQLVDTEDLPPFSFTLDAFRASYQTEGQQRGAPRSFEADVTFKSDPSSAPQQQTIGVNEPLVVDGAKVFLIGHGYAPVIQVKDKSGRVVYDAPTVFLPTDGNFTSTGVVKMPDNDPQIGLQAIFLPTATVDPSKGPISTFPAPDDPALFMAAWTGNLGLDNGVTQSVYTLDVSEMQRTGIKALKPGESWNLPGGDGTVSFTGIAEYATMDIAHDPGKEPALIAALLAILGLMLSLFIPRRRAFVRVSRAASADRAGGTDGASGGQTRVEVAGLSRTDEAGLRPTIDELAEVVAAIAPPPVEGPEPSGPITADIGSGQEPGMAKPKQKPDGAN